MVISSLLLGLLWSVGMFNNPGGTALLLLFFSLGVAVNFGVEVSVWFGVMIWLVFISGLMVIFLFFCALTPNLSWGVKLKAWPCVITLSLMVFTSYEHSYDMLMGATSESQPLILLQGTACMLLIWLASYLLATMVVVVKSCPSDSGALREP